MKFWKNLILGYIGGMLYVAVELLWRGRSHPSMFVLGGLCFSLLTALRRARRLAEISLAALSALGAGIITALEFLTGLLVNRSLTVWDYSRLPLNLMGQICLPYYLLWVPMAAFAMTVGGHLRTFLFAEPPLTPVRPAFRPRTHR